MAKRTKSEKVITWLIFSVVFSLLPVGINLVIGRATHPHPPLIESIIGGELLLISAAIAADALGRAFLGGTKYRIVRLMCGAGCLFSLVGSSLYFLPIAVGQRQGRIAIRDQNWDAAKALSGTPQGDEDIAADSIVIFGLTVITAFGAILVEED